MILENRWGRVEVRPQGAQVLSWKPADGRERLWVSPRADWTEGAPLRGGIPLCTPWFANRHQPLHGFARNKVWSSSGPEDGETTRAVFTLADDAETRALWPVPFLFEHEVVLGPELTLRFRALNRGDQPAPFELAWHTYFAIRDLAAVRVSGLAGFSFFDKNRDRASGVQQGDLSFKGPTDLLFPQVAGDQVLSEPGSSLTISSTAPGAVVWNAGERDALVGDLGSGAHEHYVCVERGAVDAPILLQPGVSWEVSMTLTVRPPMDFSSLQE